jgi:flagellar biosynthesis protein FliQ
MTEAQFLDLLGQTLWTIVLLSAPVLGTSLIVGLAISVMQAVTQIQESTLTFVPKILVSLAVLMITAPWMVDLMLHQTQQYFALMIKMGQSAGH